MWFTFQVKYFQKFYSCSCKFVTPLYRRHRKTVRNTLFNEEHWLFQQDSSPAHKSKPTQHRLKSNITVFIPADDWLSWSSDFNTLYYSLCSELEHIARRIPNKNFGSLKKSLLPSAKETVRAVFDQWPNCLRTMMYVKAKGDQFEKNFVYHSLNICVIE